ncbi:MAG: D-amino-acid transaminase [Prolixibacteraceae bacterium]
MSEIVYLNGGFVAKDEAKISPDDRGFLFADGVYEVIKFYYGKPFRFEDHLSRLKRSLRELRIDFDGIQELEKICLELINTNNLNERHAGIYIQITRGVNKRVHFFPKGVAPTIYAFASELPSAKENLENGIKVVTQEDIRWHRCDIKSVSLLPNTMMFNEAVEAGAGEVVLIRNGVVTEATHSSLLGVKNRTVFTHPLTNHILPGITRKVILEICEKYDIPFEERAMTEKELFGLDELIVAGTGTEVTPVVQIDERPVGNKKPGEITRFIQQKFFEMV